MDFATRKKYYNRCDPYEPLDPDSELNVDLDQEFGVRGVSWVDRLAARVELAGRKPAFELFTGLLGSGKSTELRRLVRRLAKHQFLVVLADAEDFLDLANPVDIPDLLSVIVYQTERVVLEKEGKDPEAAQEDGYFQRFWSWLKSRDAELSKAEFGIPSGPKLVYEIKARPQLRERVRQTIAAHFTEFLKDVRAELEVLQSRTTALGFGGLVVIFDSLEKLRGTSQNWDLVLNSAERVFTSGASYLRLPVHVIYTVPPALLTRCAEPVEFMPMIKLRDRLGIGSEAGHAAARELVRRRVPDPALCEILGAECEERLAEMIRWSGGYPRELVRLLQTAIAQPALPLTAESWGRIGGELRGTYRLLVPSSAYSWLAEVAATHALSIQDDDHRPIADLMLRNNAVLHYLNEEPWFDLHPAVYEIPGVREAIDQRSPGSEAPFDGD